MFKIEYLIFLRYILFFLATNKQNEIEYDFLNLWSKTY